MNYTLVQFIIYIYFIYCVLFVRTHTVFDIDIILLECLTTIFRGRCGYKALRAPFGPSPTLVLPQIAFKSFSSDIARETREADVHSRTLVTRFP